MNKKFFKQTIFLQMKNSFSRDMFKFTLLVSPIFNVILLYYMFKNKSIENLGNYIILSSGLMSLWSCICFSSVGDIMREKWSGTLITIFNSPCDFRLVLLGKIIGNTILGTSTFIISYLFASIILRTTLQINNIYYFILSFLVVIISFILISTVFAYFLTLSRKTGLYMNLIEIPIIFICGFSFPISILPIKIQILGRIFPQTYAINLLRASIDGNINNININIKFELFGFIVTAVLFIIISELLYKRICKEVKIKGSLEMY